MLTALKKKERFCLSLKNGDQPFFVLAATLKNLGAKWLSEKKKKISHPANTITYSSFNFVRCLPQPCWSGASSPSSIRTIMLPTKAWHQS